MFKDAFRHLMLEPTNICNLSCPICPYGNKAMKRAKGMMAFSQFQKIVDPAIGVIKSVNLWGYGEPLAAKDAVRMVDYLGKRQIMVRMHTNGLLIGPDFFKCFNNNYYFDVSFSIDGADKKSYDLIRRGGDFAKAMSNMKKLVALKKKNKLDNTIIKWQVLLSRANEMSVPRIVKKAKEIGVDILRLKKLGLNKKDPKMKDYIPLAAKYQRTWQKKYKICEFIKPGIPTVLYNGDVVPCCIDYDGLIILGNALKQNIIDIWHSEVYKTFRNKYFNKSNKYCYEKCRYGKSEKYYEQYLLNKEVEI